jgi:hypothetical protein
MNLSGIGLDAVEFRRGCWAAGTDSMKAEAGSPPKARPSPAFNAYGTLSNITRVAPAGQPVAPQASVHLQNLKRRPLIPPPLRNRA